MDDFAKTKEYRGMSGFGRVQEVEKWLIRRQMANLGDPPLIMALGNECILSFSKGQPVGMIIFRDRKTLLRFAFHPELYFGDAYCEGKIEVEGNLVEILKAAFRTMAKSPKAGMVKISREKVTTRPRLNSLNGSKKNIHEHYDIGNDFYQLWLDENMQYTCAYFPTYSTTLEKAQIAKMDHVCRKLMLKPGETVVEAGCGWGLLAMHMAKQYGVKVKAYNISHEQIAAARARAKAERLDNRVEYIEDDYRNIKGKFDVFVSVGMLEHVGARYYRELGSVIARSLKESGKGLIHSIGRNKAEPMNAWLERRIFPGAYSPTLREMMEIFEPYRFSIIDVENLRLHYARTLEHWLARFEQEKDRIGAMFDERFVRSWRLYLAGSIAAFATGSLQLFQVVFADSDKNDLPWTRAHLYQEERGQSQQG